MNEEIYEGTPAKEDVLIGTDSGYNRYRRPDGSTYVHYPYSRMATVTAYSAKDKNGQPIRTADGKLITGKTQAEADRKRFRYDMNHWVEANRRKTAHLPEGWRERIVTPDMDTFNAITGGVFNLTPIQVGRGIYNLSQGKDPRFILGNSGVVSEEYAQEHPWLALGANVLGEGLVGGFIYGAPKLYNASVKGIRNYRMSRAFDKAVRESNPQTILNQTFPGQIGQEPKQIFTGQKSNFSNTDKTGAIVFRGGNPKPRYSKYPYYYTTDPKYAANFGDVKMGILDVSDAIPAKYRFINDSFIDMNFGESQLLYNGKQPLLLQGHDLVTGEFIPSRGIEYATYQPKFTPLKYR